MSSVPRVGDGFEADVEVQDQHLRLFSEVHALGYIAIVCHVNAKHEVTRRDATDLEDGKKKAEAAAAEYFKQMGITPPVVKWKINAQTQNR